MWRGRERFEIDGMLLAFGRLWLYDRRCSSLVTVDPRSGRPGAGPTIEPAVDEQRQVTPAIPQALLASRSALWLNRPGTPLLRIDPASSTVEQVDAAPDSWFTANATGVFGLSAGPRRVLSRFDDAGRQVTRRDWHGYVAVGTATTDHLWLVDRTTERLVRLAGDSLHTEWEHDFAGGEVTHLFAADDGVIAVHNRGLEQGIQVSNVGILNRSQVYRVDLDGRLDLVAEIGTERALAYDGHATIWIGRADRAPDFRGDPAGRLTRLDLRSGTLASSATTAPGAVTRIVASDELLFVAGFQRERSRLWHVGPRKAERIALDRLPLSFAPSAEIVSTSAGDAAALAAKLRSELTAHGTRFDHRQDRWVGAGQVINRRFTLREVRVDPAAPRVTVTFDWSPEPGTVFGFDFGPRWLAREYAYGPGLDAAADNIWLFALEELDTGLMERATREIRDGVTWISTDEQPPRASEPARD